MLSLYPQYVSRTNRPRKSQMLLLSQQSNRHWNLTIAHFARDHCLPMAPYLPLFGYLTLLKLELSVREIASLLGYKNHLALNTYINKRKLREQGS